MFGFLKKKSPLASTTNKYIAQSKNARLRTNPKKNHSQNLTAAVTQMNINLNRLRNDPRKDDKYLETPSSQFTKAVNTLISTCNNAFINSNTSVSVLDFPTHNNSAKLALKTIIIVTFQLLLFSGRVFDKQINQAKTLIQTINAYLIVCTSPTKLARFINNINLAQRLDILDITQLQARKQNIQSLLAQSYKISQIPKQFIDKNKLNKAIQEIDLAIKAKSQRQAIGATPSSSNKGQQERNRFAKVKTNLLQHQKNKGLSAKKAKQVVRTNMKNMKRRMNAQQGAENKEFYKKSGSKNTIKFNRYQRKMAQKDAKALRANKKLPMPPKPVSNKKALKLQINQKYKALKQAPKNATFPNFKAKTMAEIKQLQFQIKNPGKTPPPLQITKPTVTIPPTKGKTPPTTTPPKKGFFGFGGSKPKPTVTIPPTKGKTPPKPVLGKSKSLPNPKKPPFKP